jgi:hypothetical protein
MAPLAVLVLIWLNTPTVFRARRDGLRRYLEGLLNRGYYGAHMIVNLPRSAGRGCFIQFRKYLQPDGAAVLEFGFPLARWSESYYERVCSLVEREELSAERVPTGRSDVREFLQVNLGQDLDAAQGLATAVMREVFGVSPDEVVRVTLHDISPLDERIGT